MKNTLFFIGARNKKIEKKAKELDFKRVYFVKPILQSSDISNKNKIYDVALIKTKNLDELRKYIDKASSKFEFIFILGTSDRINRIALENKKTTALASPEYKRKNDFLHYRNSGLNHILCKIAYNNNKIIIENFSDLLLEKKEISRALILGRMIQNAKLCKKYKTEFILGNFIDKKLKAKYNILNFERILLS